MVKEITETRLVKEGFSQAYLITDSYELLYSDIKKGTDLSSHSHLHKQFVYCFQGEFDLIVNEKKYRVAPGNSLIIDTEAVHSVDAVNDFRSIDLKYISGEKEASDIRFGVFEEKINNNEALIEEVFFNGFKLTRIMSKNDSAVIELNINQKRDYIIIVSRQTKIRINNREWQLFPMKIYKISEKENLSLCLLSRKTELFFFEL